MSELSQQIETLRSVCLEQEGKYPIGAVVGWRTPSGRDIGVVVGRDEKDLICVTAYDKSLRTDKGLSHYRDAELTAMLAKKNVSPTVMMDVQRVPIQRAHLRTRLHGAQAKSYLAITSQLNLESVMFKEVVEVLSPVRDVLVEKSGGKGRMWIKKSVKHKGRLAKILGMDQERYKALGKREKVRLIDVKLQALKGRPGKEARSMRGALILGKRFVRGIQKERGKGRREQ